MSMKIIKLTAENYKRLKAVEITPEGNTVMITGRNGQGKSSILDAIMAALDGSQAAKKTSEPIRKGEKTAKIVLDLGDIVVTRHWTDKDHSYLVVENKDGMVFKSPQSILDALVGSLAFDPLEFAGLNDKEQRAALLDCIELGIDIDKNLEGRATFFAERTDTNREVKRLEGVLSGMTAPEEDTPTEEVSSVDVFKELDKAQELQRHKDHFESAINNRKAAISETGREIANLEMQLKMEKDSLGKVESELKKITVPDIKTIQEKIGNLEETNAKARSAAEYIGAVQELDSEKQKAQHLTAGIEELDKLKADAISAAKMPVKGLSVDEAGLVFNGVPFSQASSAEQLEVSVAMAMAINPKLRVLRIQDGSLLDKESMKIIEKLAKDKDYQVWIEVVDDTGKVGVYIEDGEIAKKK